MVIDRDARRALERAHLEVYRWPTGFGGFAASIEVRVGEWVSSGVAAACPPQGAHFVPATLATMSQQAAPDVVSVLTRLTPRSFGNLDGAFAARYSPHLDRPSGRAIELVDEPRRTVRWVGSDGLSETEYDHGGRRVGVSVLGRVATQDGRWLPSITCEWVMSDPRECRDVFDEWELIDDVPVPSRRTIVPQQGGEVVEIVFSGHSLLPGTRR